MGRTIAIVDLAHCGTTMTAGILERIGVPMIWAWGDRGKLEDADVIEALNLNGMAFAELTEKRKGHTWGFKYPGAWLFADQLKLWLYNPVYLAIYKDPVSVALRRFGRIGDKALWKTAKWMADNIDGLRATGLPVHWLSYNHAIMRPCDFTMRLAKLAGVEVAGGQMDSVLEWVFPKGQA